MIDRQFLVFFLVVLLVAGLLCIIAARIPGLPGWMVQAVQLLVCVVALIALIDNYGFPVFRR